MVNLTESLLQKCMPKATKSNVQRFWLPLEQTIQRYSINTPERLAAFLAQLAWESGFLRYVKELASGKAYDTGKLALNLGNTPEADGDGERYKGRGLIQITGTTNYRALSKALGIDFLKNPEKIEEPLYAALSAGWFWDWKKLNIYADKNDFLTISKRINGVNKKTGLPNHYDERVKCWDTCKKALNVMA